jgi:P27 family predicted phage terminase small subunit
MKLITGNPGRRPVATPPRPPATLPQCPAHLSKLAKAEWKRLAPQLHELGLLTALDRPALALYCQSWARWVEAEQQLAADGLTVPSRGGVLKANPWVAIVARAQQDMHRLAAEFGMTPLARQRVKVEPPRPDPFDDLLSS